MSGPASAPASIAPELLPLLDPLEPELLPLELPLLPLELLEPELLPLDPLELELLPLELPLLPELLLEVPSLPASVPLPFEPLLQPTHVAAEIMAAERLHPIA